MTWLTVLGVVLRLLEPALKVLGERLAEWLEEVLRRAASELAESPTGYYAPGDLAKLFAAARGETWLWQLGKRGVLRIAERAATKRADTIYANVKRGGGYVAPLTFAEVREFEGYGPPAHDR